MNDSMTLAAYLQKMRLAELHNNINLQVVKDCMELIASPVQQVVKNYLDSEEEIDLFKMIYIALDEAGAKLPQELTEADATAIISRVIGNVTDLFDKIAEYNCPHCMGVPEEIIQVASALNRGHKGLGHIVIIDSAAMQDYFKRGN